MAVESCGEVEGRGRRVSGGRGIMAQRDVEQKREGTILLESLKGTVSQNLLALFFMVLLFTGPRF
jgi:hypothetical protein